MNMGMNNIPWLMGPALFNTVATSHMQLVSTF